MAYIKEKQLNNGFSASYWRLENVEIFKKHGYIIGSFAGYKDKATRLADSEPVTSISIKVDLADVDLTKDIYEEVYKASKNAQPEVLKFTMVDGVPTPEEPFFKDAVID